MADVFAVFERHLDVLFAIAFLWITGVAVASALYRKSKGKTVIDRFPESPLFLEKWTSGRSLRSLMTKLGGARNCLYVAVTEDAVIIRPHFPFTLLFLPEYYGLDWTIPRAKIGRVTSRTGLLKEHVLLEFSSDRGSSETVELTLRDPEKFKEVFGK